MTDFKIAIYVIDDEADARTALEALLLGNEIENFTVFADPVKLLESMHEGVQICIIDYELKNNSYNGITLMKRILQENVGCKCIMLSGYDDKEFVKMFVNNGGFKFVTKGEKDVDKNIIQYIHDAMAIILARKQFAEYMEMGKKEVNNALKLAKELR